MTTFLIILLILLDLALIAAVFFVNRKQTNQAELLGELTEERQFLTELRNSIHEEMQQVQARSKETIKKITHMATEVEQEVKSGGKNMASEVEKVVEELSSQFEQPLKQLNRKQAAIENLIRRADKQRQLLTRALERSEKLTNFFNKQLPYEDVIEQLQDKKYQDARHLLAKGLSAEEVAREVGMPSSEVRLLAGLT